MFARLRRVAASLGREVQVYKRIRRDPRTPWPAKCLLAAAIGYFLLPFDLIPDFIPVVGHLDDVIVVPALVLLALRLVPPAVVDDARRSVSGS